MQLLKIFIVNYHTHAVQELREIEPEAIFPRTTA